MHIQTIHQPGSARRVNEDSILVKSPIFGVFDGASGLVSYVNDHGQTGALIASALASSTFSAAGSYPLTTVAIKANHRIKTAMNLVEVDTTDKTALWATSAAVVRLEEHTFDWFQIGDSLILVILKDASFRLLVTDYDHDLETMKLWRRFADQQIENIREIIEPFDLDVTRKRNIDYGVLDGEVAAEKFFNHGTESLYCVAHILIFTDGLFLPKKNPEEPDDWKTFVDLFLQGGLEKIQKYVREKEMDDPRCWKYPRFKQHDDMGAIALSFD